MQTFLKIFFAFVIFFDLCSESPSLQRPPAIKSALCRSTTEILSVWLLVSLSGDTVVLYCVHLYLNDVDD